MSWKHPVFFFFLVSSFLNAQAQLFGGNPPSLRWSQINDDTARIIFPRGLDRQAKEVFSIIHALSQSTLKTIGDKQRKINIVFQNQTTVANAYVGLAPFRSEFQLTADQNSFELGSLPWHRQLVIHEYRHVQQYNNFRVGLSKAFYFLFGEGGQDFANSLSVPNWFFEGDAVYQETLVSRQGRGRLPFFFNGYHSLWAADKKYSYMKLRNGSLRDFIPDHYPLGYMLVAYGREKYGDDFWRKVTHDAASFRGLFYPMQKAVHRYSGITFQQFSNDAIRFFSGDIKAQSKEDSSVSYAMKYKHYVVHEEFPQFMSEMQIVYARSTYKQPPVFVIRDLQTNRERKIVTKSVSLDNYFSYRNNKLVYAAYEPDLRWAWKDYSIIRVIDIKTGKDHRITAHTKYFSPDISENGEHIVVVQQATDGKSALHVLDAETGRLEKEIPNNSKLYFSQPKFSGEQHVAVAVRNEKGEMALALIDSKDGSIQYLTPFSENVIGFLSVQNDTVYFTASHHQQDNLYAAANGHLYKVELPFGNHSTGRYQLQSSNQNYLWTEFTASGFKSFLSRKKDVRLTEITPDALNTGLYAQNIHTLENEAPDLQNETTPSNQKIASYSQSFHLINFHSWRPYITDPDYMFSLESQNILNTLQSDLYFDYNRNERYKQLGVDITYSQLFPWIDLGGSYTFNRNALYRNRTVFWNEAQARGGLSIPLNLSRGKHFTGLQIGGDLIYNQRYFQGIYKDTFDHRGYAYTFAYLNFTNQTQQERLQIYPRFAQSLALSFNHAVTTLQGSQFLASSYFYLPGLTYTHSVILSAAFQQRDSMQQISFSNSFPFSRGYSSENFFRMYRFGGNYHFPLSYPDWGFGNIVYFLRIRANLFYDYTKVLDYFTNGNKFSPEYRSFGSEIFFDTKWWNQLPVSFGIRYSHLMDADFWGRSPNQWEFILPINLLSR